MADLKELREKDIKLLKEAINDIRTMDIKGNPYADVPAKVEAFRFLYPRGAIKTHREYLEGEIGKRVVGYRCEVFDDMGNFLSDGEAEEKEGSTFINKTSFIENCQTSAVGRALSFMGLIKGKSIASYEEVSNAQANQEEKPVVKATEKQIEMIKQLYAEDMQEMIKGYYKVNSIEELTVQQASQCISKAKERNNG